MRFEWQRALLPMPGLELVPVCLPVRVPVVVLELVPVLELELVPVLEWGHRFYMR